MSTLCHVFWIIGEVCCVEPRQKVSSCMDLFQLIWLVGVFWLNVGWYNELYIIFRIGLSIYFQIFSLSRLMFLLDSMSTLLGPGSSWILDVKTLKLDVDLDSSEHLLSDQLSLCKSLSEPDWSDAIVGDHVNHVRFSLFGCLLMQFGVLDVLRLILHTLVPRTWSCDILSDDHLWNLVSFSYHRFLESLLSQSTLLLSSQLAPHTWLMTPFDLPHMLTHSPRDFFTFQYVFPVNSYDHECMPSDVSVLVLLLHELRVIPGAKLSSSSWFGSSNVDKTIR